MKCFLDNSEENIVVGNVQVLRNCIEVLGVICGLKIISHIDYRFCPDLSPISISDLSYMRNHLSRNKAITFDGFTDEWFL
jgi:hypothetical protein